MRIRMVVMCVAILMFLGFCGNQSCGAENPIVVLETSMGTIEIELWRDKAPVTVENFLKYTDVKFYDGTVFHRVIKGFMVQGGGFDAKMMQKRPFAPIKNEAKTELKNKTGTIAMARTQVVNSATSQFFINVKDNVALDHKDETPRGFGYAVFGEVVSGMDVVDKIKVVQTGVVGRYRDVPMKPIIIKSVRRKGLPKKAAEKKRRR